MKVNERGESGVSDLIEVARRLGVSAAALIDTSDIIVEDDLANLCREPQCENYGMAASCPPYVDGPSGFRELLEGFRQAVVFKLDVPSESLFSVERRGIFQLLHEVAAGIEQAAVEMGFHNSKAFAGGSCKRIFCHDQPNCLVVTGQGECRHPDAARFSMSGFGINVSKLMQAAGWTMKRAGLKKTPGTDSMVPVCGLILVG